MSTILNLCDCSTNGLPLYKPARCMACMNDCSGCGGLSTNINLKATERRIQNQVRVHESQYIDVLGAVTIAGNYLDLSANLVNGESRPASMVWGNRFNLRNQSDQREAARTGSNIPRNSEGSTNYVNVPTRGNSTRSTITANKPGAMTPGGYGVDVKHGSYARYLGKLKGRTMALGQVADMPYAQPPPPSVPCTYTGVKKPICTTSMNNKSFRFSLVSTNHCLCDGRPIPKVPSKA